MTGYINLSAFLIGCTTTFFTICALYTLYWQKQRTRYQTILGSIMAIWAIWNLKDIVITFPGMYTAKVLDWILIIDGWSALTFTVLLYEIVKPGWATGKRLIKLSLPFLLFTIVYAIWPDKRVIYAYLTFLWFYAWTIVFIGYVKVRRHIQYVRINYSNIDKIDVSWLKPVFIFAIVSQLAWLFTSLFAEVTADIVYYISVIAMWVMVLHYSWDYKPIVEIDDEEESTQKNPLPIADGVLEQMVEEKQLYLNKNLMLSDIAQALGTNRTYVSNYLSQVRGQTFYDYINQMRIEKVSIPLMHTHPEYKLEFIASESGFASISTFRRAFVRLTGQTPSQYVASKEQKIT